MLRLVAISKFSFNYPDGSAANLARSFLFAEGFLYSILKFFVEWPQPVPTPSGCSDFLPPPPWQYQDIKTATDGFGDPGAVLMGLTSRAVAPAAVGAVLCCGNQCLRAATGLRRGRLFSSVLCIGPHVAATLAPLGFGAPVSGAAPAASLSTTSLAIRRLFPNGKDGIGRFPLLP